VPACNEARHIEAALVTLLAQDYPDFEIVAIDDRSSDATGEINERLAAADSRVRPVRIETLPEGWLGKVHALQQWVRQADTARAIAQNSALHSRCSRRRKYSGIQRGFQSGRSHHFWAP
jgi:glycosyltransferase involved in cell wall biosynthesis